MKKLDNRVQIAVVDKNGQEVTSLEYRNTPYSELYKKEDVILVQWVGKDDRDRPKPVDLVKPIAFENKKFHGSFAWGSSVKRGFTIGMTRDFPHIDGPVKLVEDGQRVGRWLLSQGVFGGFTAEELTIGVIPGGTQTKAGPVEDGFGYIRKSIVQKFARKERVKLGQSRDQWCYWQRIPWEKVEDEMLPIIRDSLIDASDPSKMLFQSAGNFDFKKELYEVDEQMIEHPFVAASLNRSSQTYFSRLATSVNLKGEFRTAVPTTCPTVCWPFHEGKIAIDRSPIDSNGSIQAIELKCDAAEEARIASMEVVQHSISSKEYSIKGCLGAVDDDLLDYDIVVCADDIKMAPNLKEARSSFSLTITDAVVPFLQIWDSNSIVGVNAKWAKSLMGLDHDGDGVRLVDCNDKPKLWQAISELAPGETPKLKKSKRPLEEGDERPDMIYKSMVNLVGMATNVAGSTYMVEDRSLLASQLGFRSVENMDLRLNYFIKVGTDGFKSDVDQAGVAKEVAVMQNNISKLYGRSAPWCLWGDDNWAFKRGLPPVIESQTEDFEFMIDGCSEPVDLDSMSLKLAIWPFMDGTIAQIARIVIPALEPNWNETVPVRPLTLFRTWAPRPTDRLIKQAEEVQYWFNVRVGRVNWASGASVHAFKIGLLERVEEWLAKGVSVKGASEALWWVAHSSRGGDATAASIFMAFPDEAKRIIREKPGEKVTTAVLVGLGYQLPGFNYGLLENLEIADITVEKGGKRILRRVLLGTVEGQVPPKDESLPRNLIAFIAANEAQPDPGVYNLDVVKFGESSWMAKLM